MSERHDRREGPDGEPLELLWSSAANRGADGDEAIPAPIARRLPRGLAIAPRSDRPTIFSNFVESLDGIVALAPDESSSGGAEISGYSEPDRLLMAVLRAVADAVIVGGGTARAGRHHEWTARFVEPDLAPAFAEWRRSLGLAPQPATVVVTGRGDVDPEQAGLCAPDVPVIFVTTGKGAATLAGRRLPGNARVEVASDAGDHEVTPAALVEVLRRAGLHLALCEGGPHLLGELLAADLVDEMFLTLAPQLLGRGPERRRLGLVEGVTFGADGPPSGASGTSWPQGSRGPLGPWPRLVTVRRAGDHLFLQYRFER